MFKKINVMYKETIGANLENNKEKCIYIDDKNLLDIAKNYGLSEKEIKNFENELNEVLKKEKEEILKLNNEIKSSLSNLNKEIIGEQSKEIIKKIDELKKIIQNIIDKKEKTEEDMKEMRKNLVQSALLNVSLKYS